MLDAAHAIAAVALLLTCTLAPGQGETPPTTIVADPAASLDVVVNRVITGDSLDAHVSGRRTAVRYLGVETPSPDAPCGQDALDRNRELAGARVLLEEESAYLFDDRGRRLYYAFTSDGRSIDEILIREGLGRAVRLDARYGAYLASVQAEAETAKRGCLWAE